MAYGLTRRVINSSSFTPLSEGEYHNLVRSMNNLHLIVFIEEQLDLMIGNYIELETDLLAMATRGIVSAGSVDEYIRERNFIVNRRIGNLLNACRGYLDHTKHHLNSLRSDTDGPLPYFQEFKAYSSHEYDTFLEYRVMEELRNHTQHAGFPIALVYDRAWVGDDDNRKQRFNVKPCIVTGLLGKEFKKKIRAGLEKLGEQPDLMPMLRQYVGSLGSVHETLRNLLQTDLEEWENTVVASLERFGKDHPHEQARALWACEVQDNETSKQGTWIAKRPIDYRRALRKRNNNLGNLARCYVTSESR